MQKMNEVTNNIKCRRSIRKYKKKRLPKNVIKEIIKAGTYAPSSHNSQPWKFIVIGNKKEIKNISDYIRVWFKKRALIGKIIGVFNNKIKDEINSAKKRLSADHDLFFYGAPLLILICAKPGRFAVQNCSLAAENMMLAARSLKIGSCWIGFADLAVNKQKRLMERLGVPKGHKIMAHLIFGYPLSFPEKAQPRKEDNIIKWD